MLGNQHSSQLNFGENKMVTFITYNKYIINNTMLNIIM